MARSESEDRAVVELLQAMAVARTDGDPTAYDSLLREATSEPARSVVLVDVLVRLLLQLVEERSSVREASSEDLLRILAMVLASHAASGDGPRPGPAAEADVPDHDGEER